MTQKSKNSFKLTKEQEAALKAAKGVFRIGKTLYLQFKVPNRTTAQKKSLGYPVTLNNIKLAEQTLGNIKVDIANGTYKNDSDAFWQKHFPMDTSHLKSGIGIEQCFTEYINAHTNYLSDSKRDKLASALSWALHYELGTKDVAQITTEQLNLVRQATVKGTKEELIESRRNAFYEELKNDHGKQAIKSFTATQLSELERTYNRAHPIYFSGCAASTVTEYTKAINQVLEFAAERGYIKFNPSKELKKLAKDTIKLLKQVSNINPFSQRELSRLLEVIHVPQVKDLVTFLAWTGLRHGELKALAWEDVDLENRRISVRYNLTRKGNIKLVKTEAGIRTVELLPAALEVLIKHKERSYNLPPKNEVILGNNQKSITVQRRRVFLSRDNEPYKRPELTTVPKQWEKWLIEAELEHRPPYQLRHTYASRMLMKRVPATWLAKQMGHADTNMIAKIYGKWLQEDEPDFMENLAKSLGQQY